INHLPPNLREKLIETERLHRKTTIEANAARSAVVIDEVQIEFVPDTVPRLEIGRADYIDQLAETVTAGTKLPFSFARETFKMLFLAALEPTRPVLPWFHKLHTREYVILVSENPNDGKGETFRRCQATIERAVNEHG